MKKRGFIWWALRVSFCLSIVVFAWGMYSDQDLLFYPFLFILLLTIDFSIVNLKEYKNKTFAIISLILSIIFFSIGSLWLIIRAVIQ